jgi:hypothetical protein
MAQGDIVIVINLPACRQGHLTVQHSQIQLQQVLGVLKGLRSTLPGKDPRVEEAIEEFEKAVAHAPGETTCTGILASLAQQQTMHFVAAHDGRAGGDACAVNMDHAVSPASRGRQHSMKIAFMVP